MKIRPTDGSKWGHGGITVGTGKYVGFEYEGNALYCGSDSWTKAEKDYMSDKVAWELTVEKSSHGRQGSSELYHGDVFHLDNKAWKG